MHDASTATCMNPHKFGDSHGFIEQHSDSWAIEDNTFDSSTHIHDNKNPTFQSKKKPQKQNMLSTSTALTPHKPGNLRCTPVWCNSQEIKPCPPIYSIFHISLSSSKFKQIE